MNRTKVFARIQTAQDHEVFVDGLLRELVAVDFLQSILTLCADEIALRRRITELQEYRKMGLTTAVEAERYERDRSQRVRLLPSIEIIAG